MTRTQATEADSHPFWQYSVAVYDRPGVAASCLALQDGRGADVNILLYCCWRAACGDAALDRAALEPIISRVASWRNDVIAKLRAVRVRTKTGITGVSPTTLAPFRESLKALELDAEFIEQAMLAEHAASRDAAATSGAEGARAAAAGMVAYLSLLEPEAEPSPATDVAGDLRRILAGAFPDVDEAVVSAAVASAVSRP